MRTIVLCAALVLAVGGCDLKWIGGYIQLREAKADVASDMLDPDSAEFRNIEHARYGPAGYIVCGEVNGKNAFGAKAGFQRFMYVRPLVRFGSDGESGLAIRQCCKAILESGKVDGVRSTADVAECAGVEPAMML